MNEIWEEERMKDFIQMRSKMKLKYNKINRR